MTGAEPHRQGGRVWKEKPYFAAAQTSEADLETTPSVPWRERGGARGAKPRSGLREARTGTPAARDPPAHQRPCQAGEENRGAGSQLLGGARQISFLWYGRPARRRPAGEMMDEATLEYDASWTSGGQRARPGPTALPGDRCLRDRAQRFHASNTRSPVGRASGRPPRETGRRRKAAGLHARDQPYSVGRRV